MASPFRIFRKYQKTLLVVAGVVLMFVFVIGDALVSYLGGSPGGQGTGGRNARAVAVRWDGGSLTNAELYELVMRRRILKSFTQSIAYTGAQALIEAGLEPRLRVPLIPEQNAPTTPEQGVERSVVQTRIFADAARRAGMQVSNETLVQYLDELGSGKVTRDQMREMLRGREFGGVRVSIDYVLDALREEMLARNYVASYQFAFDTVTPQQRWEDWLSVNDRVVIEAASLPAESFLDQAPEPTEAELTKFFDEHKNREPQPDFVGQLELPSPTPGFAIPRKVDVQFIQAEYDSLFSKIESQISEEEIGKYYEENKSLFIKTDTGLIEEEDNKQDSESPQPAAEERQAPNGSGTGAETALPQDQPSTEEFQDSVKVEETPESNENEAAPSNAPANEKPSTGEPVPQADKSPNGEASQKEEDIEPQSIEKQSTGGEPANESKPEAAQAGESDAVDLKKTQTPEGEQSSGLSNSRSIFRLAAFQENPAEGSEEESSDQGASDDSEPSNQSVNTSESSSTNAAGEQTGNEVPSVQQPEADTPPAKETGLLADKAKDGEKPVEYQPLEEVRDLIRRELASRRTADELTRVMSEIHQQLDAEFNRYVLSTGAEGGEPPPGLADLAPLAEKHGLKHGRTGPVSFLELRELPVGRSGSTETGEPLVRMLFVDRDVQLFQPQLTVDVDGNRYVVLKMADTPGRVPALTEVKDKVVRAWKLQRAAELALKRAEELAKEADKASVPLSEFFTNDPAVQVVRTDPFSQFTGGDVSLVDQRIQPFRLSQPEGIVAPGPEFMRRVFEMKPGQVAAVQNHDRSIAYVVRLVEHLDSPEELRAAYLSEANSWPGMRLMTTSHAQLAARLLVEDLVAGTGLKWERPPDQIEGEEEGQGEAG
jgi:hypothetical protein